MANLKKIRILLVFMLILVCNPAHAVDKEEIRIRAALDLFPSILAADMSLKNKKGADGSLLLVLVYIDEKEKALEMAGHLGKVDRIRGIPIRIEVADVRSLGQFEKQVPAGLFLTQSLSKDLNATIAYGRKHEIIVFSPFEGDVERGVSGGIHISDRVLPYINRSAIKLSHIRIKPFFLRVAVQYAE